MRDVSIRQNTIGINARLQETGGPLGEAKLTNAIAQDLREGRDKYVAQANENAYMQGQGKLVEEMSRLQEQHTSDPDGLRVAIEDYSESFLDEIEDETMRERFSLQITKSAQSSIAKATAKRKQIVNEQAKFHNLKAFEGIKSQLNGVASGLLSDDSAVALAASEELQEVLQRSQGILGATDADGVPLFGASFRVNQLSGIKDNALQTAFVSWFENQPDKVTALKTFEQGELSIALPNGEGGFDDINVRDSVSPQTAKLIQSAAKTQIREAQAQEAKQRQLFNSQIELALDTVRDDPALIAPANNGEGPPAPGQSRAQKLNDILQAIDNSPYYNGSIDAEIAGNKMRAKVFKQLEESTEKQERIITGAAFASGDAPLNPQSAKQTTAFNEYYESVAPQINAMPPEQRNKERVSIINNSLAVPKMLKGDITRVARSNDIESIKEAVNLMDLVGSTNPHLIDQLASEGDRVRMTMINDRINMGYDEEAAIQYVDEQLNPRNKEAFSLRMTELNNEKIDYRAETTKIFDTEIFGDGFDNDDPLFNQMLDGPSVAYRTKMQDMYRKTGDLEGSRKMAADHVKGMYGVTSINGDKKIMAFNPEMYYHQASRHGNDPSWMREQMIDDAMKVTKDWFRSSPEKYSRKDFRENLFLIPHPAITPRTAKEGKPEYQLMYKNDYGELIYVSEGTYYFDGEKQAKKLLNEVKKEQDIIDEFGVGSLQTGLFRDLELARKTKDFDRADQIQSQLKKLGVE